MQVSPDRVNAVLFQLVPIPVAALSCEGDGRKDCFIPFTPEACSFTNSSCNGSSGGGNSGCNGIVECRGGGWGVVVVVVDDGSGNVGGHDGGGGDGGGDDYHVGVNGNGGGDV